MLTGAVYDINSSELLENNKAVSYITFLITAQPHVFPNPFLSARSVNENEYNLRNYNTDLSIPRPKKEALKRSFKYRGALLWNSLSREAKTA